MNKNNRIQQPYGYREQNHLVTEPAMICNAITGGSASSSEIIEKINYILYNGFFGVSYDKGIDSYAFTNSLGNLIGAAKLEDIAVNQLIQDCGYDEQTKKIFIKIENGETIEVPIDELVNQLNSLIDNEASVRGDEDSRLWDAIGEVGSSGSTLSELIQQEISARTEGDEALEAALDEEVSARTNEGQRLWDAIGEMGSSGSSIVEIINNEISARTEGDEALEAALDEEISTRSENDESLLNSINEEVSARTSEDARIWNYVGEIGSSGSTLSELIQQEISARTNADDEILSMLSAETEARENEDTLNADNLEKEISARTNEDQAIWNAIGEIGISGSSIMELLQQEVSARTNGDENILEALNQEVSNRTSGDTTLNAKIEEEKNNRASADGELEGKLDIEKTERKASDSALTDSIAAEKAARLYWDNQLSGAVETEKSEREAKDNEILSLLNTEAQTRENEDEALSNSINNNKVSIVKVETALPSNVKEAYELKNTIGEVLGARINVYKDSSLKNVELVDQDDSGRIGQFLKLTYILEDGTEKTEYLDVSKFLVEAEFKDGLVVNNAGEVMVKIDPTTEAYLTVSQNGVKINGIDTIAQDLASESVNRQNADIGLETLITNEKTERQSADIELNNAIITESNDRESGDNDLRTAISSERSERISNDSELNRIIQLETSNRENDDRALNTLITNLSDDLAEKYTSLTSTDNSLQDQVNSLKSEDITLNGKVSALEANLITETSLRTSGDTDLQMQVNRKANSVDVYYKEEANSIFATKEEIPSDFYSKAEVDEKDALIKASVTAETSSRESEDARINNLIMAETQARESADGVLQNSIDSIEEELSSKLVEVKAKDVSVTVDSMDATRPQVKLNISSEQGQIIKLNADGIYAKANLTYDEENNILNFTNTNETTSISLKTRSQIDRIYYDKPNEEIVIEYTVNGSRKEDVKVPVHDLIQEWRTEDGHQGAIELTKEIKVESEDVLRARLMLNTTHSDNMAVIDNNALYVSKDAITAEANTRIAELERKVAALETALQNAFQGHMEQARGLAVEQDNSTQDTSIDELMDYVNNHRD